MIRLAAVLLCLALGACATTSDKVKLPPAPRPGEPSGIVGLNTASIRANFGAPAFVRKDGATELWRYDGTGCKAFFFFYQDGGASRVRHVETLPRGGSTAADPACLQALLTPLPPKPVS